MMSRRGDDVGLLRAAAEGDELAFEVFYRRWVPVVTSYHLRATGSRELALDLTAETFAALVSSLDQFDATRGSAGGWLFSIARHKLHDSFRRARVEASARVALGWECVAVTDLDLERVEELASRGEAVLEELLAELSPTQQRAVRERVLAERSYSAIAAEMGCSEMLVRQRVHRALRRLRSRLEEPA
jgi:RNA polymerase sigma-70 factor (ECF subfamily)